METKHTNLNQQVHDLSNALQYSRATFVMKESYLVLKFYNKFNQEQPRYEVQ